MRNKLLLLLSLCLMSIGSYAVSPTITSFSPGSGSVGTLVTVAGANLSSPSVFTIGGVSAIVVSNSGTILVAMIMPGAVTGGVSITTGGGSATASGNFTITTTPYPHTQQGAKLVGNGAIGQGRQGSSVSLSADGNTTIVGGYGDNGSIGAVWPDTRSGGTWAPQGSKLVGTGRVGSSDQGGSVSLSADGNTAIVGGYGDSSVIGAAWIYIRSGGTWTQQGNKLVGTGVSGQSYQGCSVSISADGKTAIVGGYNDNTQTGAVWVYTRSGSTWTQQGNKLVGSGAVGSAEQGYAVALSADGNTAIVGGFLDNGQVGASWVFTRSGSTWSQQGSKLVGTGIGASRQGGAVAISADGNTAIVGGSYDNSQIGAAWVFTRSGSTWSQQGSSIVGTGAAGTGISHQGSSVALSADGNTAFVGGFSDSSYKGAVWVYTRSGSTWTQQGSKLLGSGGVGQGYQGISVALSADGTTGIVGGNYDNSLAGAAWVYTNSTTTCSSTASAFSQHICAGSSYSFGGHNLTQAGTYYDTLTNVGGCDSIITLTLAVNNNSNTPLSHSICSGSSYTFGGRSLTSPGTYRDTLTSSGGCDSILVLTLSVSNTLASSFSHSICPGSSYAFGGRSLTSAGTYRDTLTSSGGCDSIVTLTLSISSALVSSFSHSICQGSSYTFGGHSLSSAGTYRDTLIASGGCDSIATLTLSVNALPTAPVISRVGAMLSASGTSGLHMQWQLNGTNLTGDTTATITALQNGTYTLIVTDPNGCDNTSNTIAVTHVGIDELAFESINISLQPNPASESCTIIIQNPVNDSYFIQVLDLDGRQLNAFWSFRSNSFSFPVSLYAKGVYLIKLTNEKGESILKRLVVE